MLMRLGLPIYCGYWLLYDFHFLCDMSHLWAGSKLQKLVSCLSVILNKYFINGFKPVLFLWPVWGKCSIRALNFIGHCWICTNGHMHHLHQCLNPDLKRDCCTDLAVEVGRTFVLPHCLPGTHLVSLGSLCNHGREGEGGGDRPLQRAIQSRCLI